MEQDIDSINSRQSYHALALTSASGGAKLIEANVIEVRGSLVAVEHDLGAGVRRLSATLALAVPYQPVVGDRVLLASDAGRHYIIGIVCHAGPVRLTAMADLELTSDGGSVRIDGRDEVSVQANAVSIQANSLDMIARQLTQRLSNMMQAVTDLLTVQAGQSHMVVAGGAHTQARNVTIVTQERITINGDSIHLG